MSKPLPVSRYDKGCTMGGREMKNGLSFIDVLALIFITLKLCGVITWSWLYVLMPVWSVFFIAAFVVVTRADKK